MAQINTLYCDRCGLEICSIKTSKENVRLFAASYVHRKIYDRQEERYASPGRTSYLCESCTNSFERWLTAEKKGN